MTKWNLAIVELDSSIYAKYREKFTQLEERAKRFNPKTDQDLIIEVNNEFSGFLNLSNDKISSLLVDEPHLTVARSSRDNNLIKDLFNLSSKLLDEKKNIPYRE